jgi:hypothetical protein
VEPSNLKWPYQMGFWSSGGAGEEGARPDVRLIWQELGLD